MATFQNAGKLPALSTKESLILKLMTSAAREWYGLELVGSSDGNLKKGTIYVTLGRMADKGFVTSRKEAATDERVIPRRLYKVTGHGCRVLAVYETAATQLEGSLA